MNLAGGEPTTFPERTLQELLAPNSVIFFARDWARIGEKTSQFARDIADVAGIDGPYLTGESQLASACIAKKMYWLSRRVTTRIEDMAYCMLGIFDINMPLLYGEGSKSFVRLQEEIIKVSNDHTIFCWTWIDSVARDWVSMLAPSPEAFKYSGSVVQSTSIAKTVSTYSITNAGLSIGLPLIQSWSYYFVVLRAQYESDEQHRAACIPVRGFLDNVRSGDNRLMQRAPFPSVVLFLPPPWAITEQHILVRSRTNPLRGILTAPESSFKYSLLVTVGKTKYLLDKRLSSLSQFGPGEAISLVEKTKGVIGLETYPRGLFDVDRSLFLFNCELRDSVYGGFLRFGQLQNTDAVVFFAIKINPRSRTLWFCEALPASSWGEVEGGRKTLLDHLATQVAFQTDDQLFNSSEKAAASAMIVGEIGSSRHNFSVAHVFFSEVSFSRAGLFLNRRLFDRRTSHSLLATYDDHRKRADD
jgi:hypothetical protein